MRGGTYNRQPTTDNGGRSPLCPEQAPVGRHAAASPQRSEEDLLSGGEEIGVVIRGHRLGGEGSGGDGYTGGKTLDLK